MNTQDFGHALAGDAPLEGSESGAVSAGATSATTRYKMTTIIPTSITTPDRVETRLGTLTFSDGFPDDATVQKVYDNLDFQRGVQAFLSSLPAASLYGLRTGIRTFGPDNRTAIIAESLADWVGCSFPIRGRLSSTAAEGSPRR